MNCRFPEPGEASGFLADHIALLSDSLKHWTGVGLMDENIDPVAMAEQIYAAPFAVLSHGTETDPVINYANQTAQQLFEMDWGRFTMLPSRLSAETLVQAEREALLRRVTESGYINDYSGIRISSSGRRFMIEQATVWNLLDSSGVYCGQAAMFSNWQYLDDLNDQGAGND